jgi:hypothetical protein
MKNQYFGDINDYLKYGLLRGFAASGFGVGVCWMLTPDDGRSDGRKIEYLSNPQRGKVHDAELFDTLSATVRRTNGRHKEAIQQLGNYYKASTRLRCSIFWNSVRLFDTGRIFSVHCYLRKNSIE